MPAIKTGQGCLEDEVFGSENWAEGIRHTNGLVFRDR